jgi:hypothetical protein
MNITPFGAELFHSGRHTDGGTDRQDEANSSFSQFCERASKTGGTVHELTNGLERVNIQRMS